LLCARDVALAQGLYCGVLHCCAGSAHLLRWGWKIEKLISSQEKSLNVVLVERVIFKTYPACKTEQECYGVLYRSVIEDKTIVFFCLLPLKFFTAVYMLNIRHEQFICLNLNSKNVFSWIAQEWAIHLFKFK
jgi:hypothetical protein